MFFPYVLFISLLCVFVSCAAKNQTTRKSTKSPAAPYIPPKSRPQSEKPLPTTQGPRTTKAQPFIYEVRQDLFPNTRIHVVTLALTAQQWEIKVTPEDKRGQTPSDFAQQTGAQVVLNAAFFDSKLQPIGLSMQDGKLWSKTSDSEATTYFACNAQLHCEMESKKSKVSPRREWHHIVSGKQLLLGAFGRWQPDDDQSCGSFCTTKHPRSALGYDPENRKVILVMAEGRIRGTTGLTLSQLTDVFLRYGAKSAVNLDGGGSSTLVLNGQRVSRRPDNEPNERPVANCIGFVKTL